MMNDKKGILNLIKNVTIAITMPSKRLIITAGSFILFLKIELKLYSVSLTGIQLARS